MPPQSFIPRGALGAAQDPPLPAGTSPGRLSGQAGSQRGFIFILQWLRLKTSPKNAGSERCQPRGEPHRGENGAANPEYRVFVPSLLSLHTHTAKALPGQRAGAACGVPPPGLAGISPGKGWGCPPARPQSSLSASSSPASPLAALAARPAHSPHSSRRVHGPCSYPRPKSSFLSAPRLGNASLCHVTHKSSPSTRTFPLLHPSPWPCLL